MKYLDYAGLKILVDSIKKNFVQQETGKGLSDENFSTELKNKLTTIESGAEKNLIHSVNGYEGVVVLSGADIKLLSTIAGLEKNTVEDAIVLINNKLNTAIEDLDAKANKLEVYSKEEMDKILTGVHGAVSSVNGKTGTVTLTGLDINVSPDKALTLAQALTTLTEEQKGILNSIERLKTTDTEQAAELSEIKRQLTSKADVTALNELKELIEAGADNEDIIALQEQIKTKAEQKQVDELSTKLEAKVDKDSLQLAMNDKVDKVEGKQLSTEDYTKADKTKVAGIEAGAQVNKVETIKRNGLTLPLDGKTVDIKVPTSLGELANDKDYSTKAEVAEMIQSQGRLKKKIVTSLPLVADAEDYTLYLIRNKQDSGYEEWMVVENNWEILGDTAAVDFDGFLKEEDINTISEEEINKLMA